jgi:carbonic anhydrase/acetyltransferase-like protein (isoleucine patch superfamily)
MIRSFEGTTPTIAESAYIDERADVIGDVTIGEDASVWPGVVLRGDEGHIDVGPGTNVQDNAICHEGVEIGPDVTVGHAAIVHAARVGERCVVGMNAVVLDDADIGHHSIVAAGSVVTEGTEVPPYSLVAGTPADVIRDVPESEPWFDAADSYAHLADVYEESSEVVDREDL